MTDVATTAAAHAPSPYHRKTNHQVGSHPCPDCGQFYPSEELLPVVVGDIVRVVSRQNREEKNAAFELAHSPRLLHDTDLDAQDIMPSALLNMKSPDWADLPPCIARYRISLYQVRHSQKLMEKMTSLCESCFQRFFPDKELPMPREPRSPNAGGGATPRPRPRGSRGITFEDWLAQSRFPDRAQDMAFSVVGQCMRHAAAEAKTKQALRDTITSALDSMDFAAIGGSHAGSGARAGSVTMLDGGDGSSPLSVAVKDAGGGIDWGQQQLQLQQQHSQSGSGGGGQQLTIPQHHHQFVGAGIAADVAAALDPLPSSILDMPFSEWLARDLWDKLGGVMEFGYDENVMQASSSLGAEERVPTSHPFHPIYSRNRLRLPNPPGLLSTGPAPPVARWDAVPQRTDPMNRKPVDNSFVRDVQCAQSLSVPESLDAAERRLLVQIMSGPRDASEEAKWDFSDLGWEVDELCSS